MYTRISKVKYAGKTYRYLRIVESIWRKGKVIQRVIANLGDINLIDKDNLYHLSVSLARYAGKKPLSIEELESVSALHYGEILLTKAIWDSLHFESILKSALSLKKKIKLDYPLCVFIMLVNRLIAPKSKLAITKWQERIYIEKDTKPKYQHFLRTLNYLAKSKEKIEESLFSRLTDLFSLKLNIIFYDLTSTYFEGKSCPLAKFGYSRDRLPDKKQIVLGLLVTDEGLPIAHQVYNGNLSDKTTLKATIDTLKKRFQIKPLRKRNSDEVKNILKTTSRNYTILSNILHFKEVVSKDIRYLICKNPQKQRDDRIFRDNLIKIVSVEFMQLSKRIDAQSKLKKAAEILALKKAKRYFVIGIDKQNNFFWNLNEEAISYEKELDGVYILKTNVQDISAYEVVKAYKNLCQVEDAFREIKDFLKLRPIYHYSPTRVKGHVMVCVLAYLIEKLLEKSLKEANLPFSPREALDYLSTLRLVENKLAGRHLLCVTTPSQEHRQILKSVGIPKIQKIFQK
ncbi:MAG: IS1634 family transposase [Candidatus Omnitrophica bacterium]|nr:IS1634 family transposase [Candidatus Omnitrophota bacterium]